MYPVLFITLSISRSVFRYNKNLKLFILVFT